MAKVIKRAGTERIAYPTPENMETITSLLRISPLTKNAMQDRMSLLGNFAEGCINKPPQEAIKDQQQTLGLLHADLTSYDNTRLAEDDFSFFQQDFIDRYDLARINKRARTITERSAAMIVLSEFLYMLGSNIGDIYPDREEVPDFVSNRQFMQSLAGRIASVEKFKDAPEDPRISPTFQEKFLATEITCSALSCFEQLATLSSRKGKPEVLYTFLTLLDTDDAVRQTFQHILTRNQPRERYFVLDFFNNIAGDVQTYAINNDLTQIQTNRLFFSQVLGHHPEFARAIQDAQEKAIHATERALPTRAPQDEKRPELTRLFSPPEARRVQLLEKLTDIPAFLTDHDKTGIEYALSALAAPIESVSSPLAIAKTYLLEHDGDSNESSIFILRWILRQALEANPALFAPVGLQLREYIEETTPTWKTTSYKKIPHADLEHMLALQMGEPLGKNSIMREKLTSGAPIIFDYSHTGLGDVLLSLPMIYDVAKIIQMRSVHNRLTIVVSKNMRALTQKILEDFPFVEVIAETEPKDTKKLFRHKATGPNGEKGAILTYNPITNLELYEEGFAEGYLYIPPLPEVTSDAEAAQWNTFRRRLQAQFSWLFQTVMFDSEHRDDISGLQTKLKETTAAYLAQYPEQQAKINKITANHKGGYVVIVDKGSTKEKQLTPSAVNAMLDMLAPFCHENEMAVVLLHSQTFDTAITPTTKRGIPVYETGISTEFAHTFTWLQSAKATIGPDTFLTHAAEFFPHPVLNLHIDSHPVAWSVDDKVRWALFAFARGLLEENTQEYLPGESEWYRQKLLHPFTLLGGTRGKRRKPLHPIIFAVQKAFEEEIAKAMEELTSLIQAS